MWAMSEADSPGDHHHGVRDLVQRMNEHHRDAVRRREEEELERAAEGAGFDLAADVAHPTAGHGAVGYDVETDLGLDNEPPEPHR
jgi:hypothetical protein